MTEKEERFQRLCREELPMLRAGVYRLVGNAADTDDIVQEALLRAYRHYGSFRTDAVLVNWVYRIAINCAYDFLRRRKRQTEAQREFADASASAEDQSVRERQLQRLEAAVAKLPEQSREAIVWGCLSDLSGHEAAARLGCTENTLYQRVFKAKQMLRRQLAQEAKDE